MLKIFRVGIVFIAVFQTNKRNLEILMVIYHFDKYIEQVWNH